MPIIHPTTFLELAAYALPAAATFARRGGRSNRRGVSDPGSPGVSLVLGAVTDLDAASLSSSPVASWDGGANDVAQATEALRPTWNASVTSFKNRPTVQANGTTQFLDGSTEWAAGNFTLHAVVRPLALASHDYLFSWTAANFGVFAIGDSNRAGAYDGTNLHYVPTGIAPNTVTMLLTATRSGSTITVRVNGPTNSVSGAFVGGAVTGVRLFQNKSGIGNLSAHLGRLVFYDSALSAGDITQNEQSLASRFGITLS